MVTTEDLTEVEYSVVQAAADGDAELLDRLLQAGWDVNSSDERGRTGLHMAASHGRETIMRKLLDSGADVSACDCHGNTPLHYCGHEETVECLLSYGASTVIQNKNSDTPVVLMQRRGVEANAILLVKEHEQAAYPAYIRDSDPLLQNIQQHRGRGKLLSGFMDLLFDFYKDVGLERLIILILVLLIFSLYAAYFVSTMSAASWEGKLPVEGEQVKVEL